MKIRILSASILSAIVFASSSSGGEITDTEWDILDRLVITYYSGRNGRVDCTAFNESGSAIGGGFSYASGGVARVPIDVPKKYQGKPLKVSCKG
ncbi:hypothetical protein N9L29_03570 [Litoricolaceae bacterium]|nr:hypothetical protein [Litorivicinaceae bacterium]